MPNKIAIAITGASGSIYAKVLLDTLMQIPHQYSELSIVMSNNAKDVRIISGTRTYAEQDALYKKGRFGNTEPQVTKAKGGQSNHNFGLAWDIALFENGKYITDDAKYIQLSKLVIPGIAMLEWGGNWQSFQDYPHYQHQAIYDTVAGTRNLFEQGKIYV